MTKPTDTSAELNGAVLSDCGRYRRSPRRSKILDLLNPDCGRCGHPHHRHGRRGHGACRVGHRDWLADAVTLARACAVAGVQFDVSQVPHNDPCTCKRFCKTRRGMSDHKPSAALDKEIAQMKQDSRDFSTHGYSSAAARAVEELDDAMAKAAEELTDDGDQGDEPTCARCHEIIHVRPGDEPTPHCHDCAHELVAELTAERDRLDRRRKELEQGIEELVQGIEELYVERDTAIAGRDRLAATCKSLRETISTTLGWDAGVAVAHYKLRAEDAERERDKLAAEVAMLDARRKELEGGIEELYLERDDWLFEEEGKAVR